MVGDFDAETTRLMGLAFETSIEALRNWGVLDPPREAIAKAIIDLAKGGERDPERLCDAALKGRQAAIVSDPSPRPPHASPRVRPVATHTSLKTKLFDHRPAIVLFSTEKTKSRETLTEIDQRVSPLESLVPFCLGPNSWLHTLHVHPMPPYPRDATYCSGTQEDGTLPTSKTELKSSSMSAAKTPLSTHLRAPSSTSPL